MSLTSYQHTMAAHCESGVISGLLGHYGLPLSEPLVFGIAGACFFGYFGTRRTMVPMAAYRSRPGDIRGQIAKRLGVAFDVRTFRSPAKAQQALDAYLDQGQPVGIQVDMFDMEYIPSWMRVHNNAHFVVAAGREEGQYVLSDCYYPQLGKVSAASLQSARFARGDFAPKGIIIHPRRVPERVDLPKAIRGGIAHSAKYMLRLPVPVIGVKGIRAFAKAVTEWPRQFADPQQLSHCFMSVNLALEERGTGGAGFRFLYATFLQQAAKATGDTALDGLSQRMMENGDRWRDISLAAARIGKKREYAESSLAELSGLIMARADAEAQLWTELERYARQS